MKVKKKDSKKPERPLLIFFYLVVILFLAFAVLVQKTIIPQKATGEDSPPKEVKISNIGSSSFTVSWLTEGVTTGMVIYSENREATEKQTAEVKTAYDSRGPVTFSKVHYVTISGLQSEKNYYFLIQSGPAFYFKNLDGRWQNSGFAEEQKTAPQVNFDPSSPISARNTEGAFSLEPGAWSACPDGTARGILNPCFRPNPVWGEVLDRNYQRVAEAIVFIDIPAKSSLISTLSSRQGKWSNDLANLRNGNTGEFLIYDPETDLIRLTALSGEKGSGSGYRLIPRVFAANCLDLAPQDCQWSPQDQTNPISLQVLASPSPTSRPSLTPGITWFPSQYPPSPTAPVNIPTPTSSLEVKIYFQGVNFQGPGKKATLIFKKPGESSLFFTKEIALVADQAGNYQGLLNPVPVGIFDIFLKSPSHLGKKLSGIKIIPGKNRTDFSAFPLMAGDLNNDNRINMEDLGIIFQEFRSENPSGSQADLNFDGKVNSEDLGLLLNNYRQVGE